MELNNYVEREVRYFIQCTQCECNSNSFDTNKRVAVSKFKKEGWTITETDVLCPSCAGEGL